MARTRRLQIGSAGVVAGLALGMLGLLPGAALADDDDSYSGCYETSTADVDEPVSTDGATDTPATEPIYICYTGPESGGGGAGGFPDVAGGDRAGDSAADGDGRAMAAAGPACAGGGSAGVSGSAGLLQPDSSAADIDVDSSAADLDEQWFSSSAMAAGGRLSRAAVSPCVREVALVGLDDGVGPAPNRIDAGAGGAAAGSNGAGLGVALTTLVGASLEFARRRRH